MKKVLLSLTAAAAFVFAAGTVNAQVNGPITGKTQVVQANANLQAEILVTIPSPGADGGAVRFGTVPRNSAINMDPRAVASTNLGFSSAPAMVSITSQPDEPLRIEYPSAVLLSNNTSGTLNYITYRPQISAINDHVALTATNREASKYLGTTNPGRDQVTADGGTGEGSTASSAVNGYVVMSPFTGAASGKVTLFVGGKLYDGAANTPNISSNIPNTKQVGFYDGEFTLNILYLN
ncbi:MAG: hypothetical protein KGP34_02960 [Bacteroidetes bacterium]|nr:hypothetical protein [Bacteroidota bacterium]